MGSSALAVLWWWAHGLLHIVPFFQSIARHLPNSAQRIQGSRHSFTLLPKTRALLRKGHTASAVVANISEQSADNSTPCTQTELMEPSIKKADDDMTLLRRKSGSTSGPLVQQRAWDEASKGNLASLR